VSTLTLSRFLFVFMVHVWHQAKDHKQPGETLTVSEVHLRYVGVDIILCLSKNMSVFGREFRCVQRLIGRLARQLLRRYHIYLLRWQESNAETLVRAIDEISITFFSKSAPLRSHSSLSLLSPLLLFLSSFSLFLPLSRSGTMGLQVWLQRLRYSYATHPNFQLALQPSVAISCAAIIII
jgi:hypothetical protein